MTRDPTTVPMIFLRIGWMDRCDGQTESDRIAAGGKFVKEHGYGHEIFNFRAADGQVFGYVQPRRTACNDESGSGIKIERLGASPGDQSLSGVLAVWVATAPQ